MLAIMKLKASLLKMINVLGEYFLSFDESSVRRVKHTFYANITIYSVPKYSCDKHGFSLENIEPTKWSVFVSKAPG